MIDFKKIEFEFGEDWDIFQEMFQEYIKSCDVMMEEIRQSIKKQDSELLKRSAHTLKGVISNFYCDELVTAARKLEEKGSQGNFDQADEDLAVVVSLNQSVLKQIIDYDLSRAS